MNQLDHFMNIDKVWRKNRDNFGENVKRLYKI